MTTLYLLRHGQTDCTREVRFCGRHDPPLNTTGISMAHALAEHYAEPPWHAIYVSPLRRTYQTGEIIAGRCHCPVMVDDGLLELDYGRWDHLRQTVVVDTPEYVAWRANPAAFAPPNGETAEAVARRASASLERIRQCYPEDDVLVVTHKATIRILVCHYLGIETRWFKDRIACPVGSMTSICFSDTGPMLMQLADVAHLPLEWRANTDNAGGAGP